MKNLKVTVNGTVYDVQVEEVSPSAPASAPVAAPAAPKAAAPATPEVPEPALKTSPKAAAPAGGEVISSPMPGTIVKVFDEPGQNVKKGGVLVVLEAMKMENNIMAPHDAMVAAVMVNQGDSVESGTPLVSLR